MPVPPAPLFERALSGRSLSGRSLSGGPRSGGPRSGRSRRVAGRAAGGLLLGLSITALGLAPGAASGSASAARPGGSSAPNSAARTPMSANVAACLGLGTAGSGARVRPHGVNRQDSNDLSAAQVAAIEHRSTVRAEARGLQTTSNGRLARPSTGSRSASAKAAFTPTTVSVYWHVVTDGKAGKLSSTAVSKQIGVLNAAYKGAGFTFKLAKTDVTTNSDWFNTTAPTSNKTDSDAKDARALKTKLHKGTRASLNVYSVKFSDGTLGYSTFPFAGSLSLDGVLLDYRSLPGSTSSLFTDYNLGDTGTHEIGHWMGLYHTFEGGCSATKGDYVSDTAAEAEPSFTCDTRDSCPSLPGTDPVRNFMDYAPDACMNTFTKGQNTRMQNSWTLYRAPKAPTA